MKVIEKMPALIDYPRGVGIDDEALRSFQGDRPGRRGPASHGAKPDHALHRQARPGAGGDRADGAAVRVAAAQRIHPAAGRPATGAWPERFPHVSLEFQRSLEGFEETPDGIRVDVQPLDAEQQATGPMQRLRAKYLVGCDGGRSPVRVAMGLPFDGKSESTRWLVIDIADEPVGTPNVSFVLDDDFPYVELALPHGVRRYEFLVPEGADQVEFESDARVQALLARVLPAHVKPNVIRRRVYMHHARIAPTFRKGRAFIAGDAAHLMPVWQGQGFNTGIRDASNLAWKLAMVVKGQAGDALLDTYTEERHSHAGAMIDLSVLVGRIFVPSGAVPRALRNVLGPLISKIGPARRYIAEMRFKPMPFFASGAVIHRGKPDPKGAVGKVFMQPRVGDTQGKALRLDDAIGLRFALISWSARCDAWIDTDARSILAQLKAVSVVVRPDCQALDQDAPDDGIVLADIDGAFKRWFDTADGGIVVLRPDRVVAAVCKPWELGETLRLLAQRMQIDPATPETGREPAPMPQATISEATA